MPNNWLARALVLGGLGLVLLSCLACATEVDLANPASFSARFDAGSDQLAGFSVAVGDVNGDGVPDLVIGAPYASFNGVRSGSVYVIYGGKHSFNGVILLNDSSDYDLRFDGPGPYAELGSSVAVGDVNGDGVPDLVIGAPKASNNGQAFSGSVYVVYGGLVGSGVLSLANQSSYSVRFDGPSADSHLGTSVEVAAFEHNGIGDLAMGAPEASFNGESASGSVYLVYGNSGVSGPVVGLSNSSAYSARFDGASAGDGFGFSLGEGDVYGGSNPELLVGAPYASNDGGSESGSVYAIDAVGSSGAVQVGSGSGFLRRYDGPVPYSELGYSVASGDVSGDGLEDLIFGAYHSGQNGRVNSGSVYVLDGGYFGADGVYDLSNPADYSRRYDGGSDNELAGYSVAAGDTSGDGSDDLIIGAFGAGYNGRLGSGSVYVVSGQLGQVDGDYDLSDPSSYSVRFDGASAGDSLGLSVAAGSSFGGQLPVAVMGAYTTSLGGSVYLANALGESGATTSSTVSTTTSLSSSTTFGVTTSTSGGLTSTTQVGSSSPTPLPFNPKGSNGPSNGPGELGVLNRTLQEILAESNSTGGNLSSLAEAALEAGNASLAQDYIAQLSDGLNRSGGSRHVESPVSGFSLLDYWWVLVGFVGVLAVWYVNKHYREGMGS